MRNRTWMAFAATLAVVAISLLIRNANSQERRSRSSSSSSSSMSSASPKVTYAIAMIHGLGEHKVTGKVTFTQVEDGVEIVADLTGLQPGQHGFHIHEFGDCSMADGKCAGAHFNPTGAPHGGPDDAKRHVGDLGNIKADGEGHATYKRVDKMIALSGPRSIIGRAVIVHAKQDDFKTVTSAGDRIGCGVIGIGDPKMMQH
jgi:superoxide dismutase, Cu-Zn family